MKNYIKRVVPLYIWNSLRNYKNKIFKKTIKNPERSKYESELDFWQKNYEDDGRNFRNDWYKPIMLAMAGEKNDTFLNKKIVGDLGCGPRGSLAWATNTHLNIGIDVLTDLYIDNFKECLLQHNMIYLKNTEQVIPIPSEFFDVLFTLNAIDHVDNFEEVCNEVLRVLKPDGEFIGSFNLNEPASATEPQCLTEEKIKEAILNKMEITHYRLSHKNKNGNPYQPFFDGSEKYIDGEIGILWVRAKKKE